MNIEKIIETKKNYKKN